MRRVRRRGRKGVYRKEGGNDYGQVNPQNLRCIFMNQQLSESLWATSLLGPVLWASTIMDSEKLHANILVHLTSDPMAQKHLGDTSDPRWTQTNGGFLRHDDQIYVPESENLRLRVLQYKHDHVLLGHFRQNKTLALIRQEYTWPGLRSFVIEFCKSCTTCMRSKSQRHWPYGFLQQLTIPEQPWNSISMDFIEQLPGSLGFIAILVVVCQLTKQSIFIPTYDTITSANLAKLFILHVFKGFNRFYIYL
jgi:Integrase zinc binding domain